MVRRIQDTDLAELPKSERLLEQGQVNQAIVVMSMFLDEWRILELKVSTKMALLLHTRNTESMKGNANVFKIPHLRLPKIGLLVNVVGS